MSKTPLFDFLTSRSISYRTDLAHAFGGVKAGVLLSQFVYWTGKSALSGGWFWKSQEEITEETALTRSETETARRQLREHGVLEERRGRQANHYRVNAGILESKMRAYYKEKAEREGGESALQETRNLDCGKPADHTETTAETTEEHGADAPYDGEEKQPTSPHDAPPTPTQPPDAPSRPTCGGSGCVVNLGEGGRSPCPTCCSPPDAPQADADAPHRVQRKRTKGWKLPPNTVCVTRGTRWGNPHKVGDGLLGTLPETIDAHTATLRAMAFGELCALVEPLRGKHLACWCPLDAPCHADTWLELAAMDKESLREWWAPCPTCGKPRTTTRKFPRMDQLCRCGRELPEAPPVNSWRKDAGQPWATWGVDSDEFTRAVQRYGEAGREVQRLGYELERQFGMRPNWRKPKGVRGWGSGLRECLELADDDHDTVIQAAREIRDAQLRMPTPYSLHKTIQDIMAKRRSGASDTVMRSGV